MIWLIFGHFIGDWALQSAWLATEKSKNWFVMLAHCMIWTACVCIALEYIGAYAQWKWIFLCIGHLVADLIKCAAIESTNDEKKMYRYLYIDQLWHLLQCWIVSGGIA